MMPSSWRATGAWFVCTGLAVLFAFSGPSERSVMGQLPPSAVDALGRTRQALAPNPAGDRTLAVLLFNRYQKPEVRSWIDGLKLGADSRVPWVKLRVLPDQGSGQQLVAHAGNRTVPVFAEPQAVVRALSLPDADHAHVLVLDGSGNVLARAAGSFNEQKAAALLQTLLSP